MNETLKITSALADETRLRILLVLKGRELCLCQLIELLNLSQSTVSRHMSILKGAGLVVSRKDGRWAWFGLPGEADFAVTSALEWVSRTAAGSDTVLSDNRRVAKILDSDLEEMCKRTYAN